MKRILLVVFAILFFLPNFLDAQNEVSQREIIALLELQRFTKGDQWTHTWDLKTPMAQWHGITIKEGKVIGLDLSNNNLQGKIPLTLGNLKHLEHLDLSNNELKGKIPVELRKFDHLKVVDLSGNQLTGHIPNTIDRLGNLSFIDLSDNQLDGRIPKSIITLSKLNSLVLANNNLTGGMPQGMERLTKLKKIYLANNNFYNLDNLKPLAQQQLVLVDVDVNSKDFAAIDFSINPEGMAIMEFDKDEQQ